MVQYVTVSTYTVSYFLCILKDLIFNLLSFLHKKITTQYLTQEPIILKASSMIIFLTIGGPRGFLRFPETTQIN